MSYRDSGMTSGPYNIARIFVEGPRETQGYGEEKSSIWWRILLLAFAHLENFCLNGSLLKVMGKVYLLRELFQDMYHSCVQRLPIWPIWVSHIRMVPWNGTNQQMELRIKWLYAFLCNDFQKSIPHDKSSRIYRSEWLMPFRLSYVLFWPNDIKELQTHGTVAFFQNNTVGSAYYFSTASARLKGINIYGFSIPVRNPTLQEVLQVGVKTWDFERWYVHLFRRDLGLEGVFFISFPHEVRHMFFLFKGCHRHSKIPLKVWVLDVGFSVCLSCGTADPVNDGSMVRCGLELREISLQTVIARSLSGFKSPMDFFPSWKKHLKEMYPCVFMCEYLHRYF